LEIAVQKLKCLSAKGIAVESTQHQFFIGASTWNEKPGSFAQIFIQNTLVFAFGM
jgi:hypothetical protein